MYLYCLCSIESRECLPIMECGEDDTDYATALTISLNTTIATVRYGFPNHCTAKESQREQSCLHELPPTPCCQLSIATYNNIATTVKPEKSETVHGGDELVTLSDSTYLNKIIMNWNIPRVCLKSPAHNNTAPSQAQTYSSYLVATESVDVTFRYSHNIAVTIILRSVFGVRWYGESLKYICQVVMCFLSPFSVWCLSYLSQCHTFILIGFLIYGKALMYYHSVFLFVAS